MKLWMSLYAMVWIALIEFLLAMTPGGPTILIYLHVLLGAAIIGITFYNFSALRNTRIAGRVKRVAQASYNISIIVATFGVLVFFDIGRTAIIPLINVSIFGIILFIHVFNSFAIITQAAAIAIAYDMWEEREFMEETEPGIVPPMPVPQKNK